MLMHVNNGRGEFVVIDAPSAGEAIRRVNAEYPTFGGYYCDVAGPGFEQRLGRHRYTSEAKGVHVPKPPYGRPAGDRRN